MPQNLFFCCEGIHKRGVKLKNIITMEQLGDIFTKEFQGMVSNTSVRILWGGIYLGELKNALERDC